MKEADRLTICRNGLDLFLCIYIYIFIYYYIIILLVHSTFVSLHSYRFIHMYEVHTSVDALLSSLLLCFSSSLLPRSTPSLSLGILYLPKDKTQENHSLSTRNRRYYPSIHPASDVEFRIPPGTNRTLLAFYPFLSSFFYFHFNYFLCSRWRKEKENRQDPSLCLNLGWL